MPKPFEVASLLRTTERADGKWLESSHIRPWFLLTNLVLRFHLGDVAQMVERTVSNGEAVGSIPSFSSFFFCPASIRHPNHFCWILIELVQLVKETINQSRDQQIDMWNRVRWREKKKCDP